MIDVRALRTALVTASVCLMACAASIPEPPASLPGPPLRTDRLAFLYGGAGPILTEPPEVIRDPILDSRWARHPVVAQRVQRWIERWTGAGARDFQIYLSRMEVYREVVDREIAIRELPRSLRYLPIIESGYATSARSSAAAVGLWQFMSGTAREVGLTVSPLLDERRDPLRATPKALDVLAEHRERFGSWYVALAAYNAGPSRVSRMLRLHAPLAPQGDSLFLVLYESLPAETRDFIPKLLAASTLAASPERYGFQPPSSTPLGFEEVTVPDATSVDVIAAASDAPQALIEVLNPQLVRGFTPPDRVTIVRVPEGRGRMFEQNYALVPPNQRVSFLEHRVQSGETFSHIAVRYGINVGLLRAANPDIEPRLLQIGQWVVVPRAPRSGERARSGS